MTLSGAELYWYDDTQKSPLYSVGYSKQYASTIYAPRPKGRAPRMVATGGVIVAFSYAPATDRIEEIAHQYGLTFVKKMAIGKGYYLYHTSKDKALKAANAIYEHEKGIVSAYPDWLYLR